MGQKADWKSVGDSLKVLGDRISSHASEGTAKAKAASSEAGPGAVDQAKAGGKAALDSFDTATRDPEVGAALKDTTNRFLDAVKISLTGGDADAASADEAPAQPEVPPQVEPPKE